MQYPYLDPVTREWVFADGRRLPVLGGGSAMIHDEVDPPEGSADDDDADDDDADDDDADDDWTAPTKVEWERMQAALRSVRREKKEQKRSFEERISNMSTEGTAATQVEIEKARIEAETRIEKKWLKRAVRAEASSLFTAAGASAANAGRLARMVDIEKVEYDDKADEFEGLEDEVEELITENPEFFRKPKEEQETPVRRPKVDGASRGQRGGGGTRKVSSAERLAAGVLGKQARRR